MTRETAIAARARAVLASALPTATDRSNHAAEVDANDRLPAFVVTVSRSSAEQSAMGTSEVIAQGSMLVEIWLQSATAPRTEVEALRDVAAAALAGDAVLVGAAGSDGLVDQLILGAHDTELEQGATRLARADLRFDLTYISPV